MNGVVLGAIAIVAFVLCAMTAFADGTQRKEQQEPACIVGLDPVAGNQKLAHASRALARGSLRILAIGSSSTSGVGATSPAKAYPEQLRRLLEARFPNARFTMINRGIGGETAIAAAERMATETTAARPDLVIWQLGTNAALAKIPVTTIVKAARGAIAALHDRNVDVLLIDSQYVNKFARHDHYRRVVTALAQLANETQTMLVRRYDAMLAIAADRPLTKYLAKDRFHMNDLGYRCLARYVFKAVTQGLR